MIRAADDYDAIRAALQQLRGRRENSSSGVLSEVDVRWYYWLVTDEYFYKPVSDRAKDALSNAFVNEYGFVGLSWNPEELKRAVHVMSIFLFEEVPAP